MRTSPRPAEPSFRSPAGDLPARLRKLVRFTEVGVLIDESLSIEAWSSLVTHLGNLEASLPWWIGDALVFGEHTYGSKYAAAVEATGRSIQTLKNYAWVARSVPVENRDPSLPWRLYREVARLDPGEQRAWLDRARAENWIADDLRRELTAAKHREQQTPTFEPATADEQGRLDRIENARDPIAIECPKCRHRFEP